MKLVFNNLTFDVKLNGASNCYILPLGLIYWEKGRHRKLRSHGQPLSRVGLVLRHVVMAKVRMPCREERRELVE